MKYYTFFLLLITISSVCSGNDYLDRVENNHNFYPPINTVEMVIKSIKNKTDIKKYIENKSIENNLKINLSRASDVNLSNVKQTMICSYIDNGTRTINAEFIRDKNRWFLSKVLNKENIPMKWKEKGYYSINDADNCFSGFVRKWERKYKKSKLRLISQESVLKNMIININDRTSELILTLIYKYPTQNMMKSGWLINSVHLNNNEFANKKENNKSIKEGSQAFFADEVLSPPQLHSSSIGNMNDSGIGIYIQNKSNIPKINQIFRK